MLEKPPVIVINRHPKKTYRHTCLPLIIAKGWTVWPWRNMSLLPANMSIANTSSLQLKAGKDFANVPIFRRDGWPSLPVAESGLCTPIGMSTNGYHGDTDEMLRKQPPADSVQTSCTEILLPHSRPHFMTVFSHPI